MVKVGERVRWRNPLDEEYSYGIILEIKGGTAIVQDSGYYAGITTVVHLRSIEKLERGGKDFGGSKKYRK